MPSVMWFRRDLRLHDLPALSKASGEGPVAALFVLDDALRKPSGSPRLAFLYGALRSLEADLKKHGGALIVRHGKPENVVPELAKEIGAESVHVSEDFGPYGKKRDAAVEEALGDVALVRTGSPYAVSPGRVTKDDGDPYKVYTPFFRAWKRHGWHSPDNTRAGSVDWITKPRSTAIPKDPSLPKTLELPEASEDAARKRWQAYRRKDLGDYADARDRPDLDQTSRMSVYLKYGLIHPRTMLADLKPSDETYRQELAWREFYATILHFFPDSARDYFNDELKSMTYSTGQNADDHLQAWKDGKTGYPIVDAGMRQLLAQGWIHNRVRMIVASFLVKDLHIEWQHGARHFMQHLVDGDLASNQHGWQWTAGTGTDASPFFRVFNPVTQGQKFDPDGAYVRRFVPELRDVEGLDGKKVHEPWTTDAHVAGYPDPIVDHKEERRVALDRYQEARG